MGKRTVFLLCFFFSSSLVAQEKEKNWNEHLVELSALHQAGPDYRLGSGDLIEINVFGVENYTHKLRISATGTINLPFVGRIVVAEMTPAELEEKLKSLLDGRLIRNPQVFVSVHEYKSHPVFILGAVGKPGQYQMTQQLNLIDVIAMAGGLDLARAEDHAFIQRRKTGTKKGTSEDSSQLDIIKINLKELLENGSLSLNLKLQGGDVINIPERVTERFFIMGDVNAPGAFSLPHDRKILVSQALAWAGGPSRTAKPNDGILVRYDDNQERQEIAVKLTDILAGKKADFPIERDDIIFIPGSRFKTVGYGLLGLIPTVASTAATEAGRTISR